MCCKKALSLSLLQKKYLCKGRKKGKAIQFKLFRLYVLSIYAMGCIFANRQIMYRCNVYNSIIRAFSKKRIVIRCIRHD